MTRQPEILGIVGSYREGGAIDSVMSEILAGAAARGAHVDKVYLTRLDIGFCTNCRECMQPPGDERVPCVVHDDEMEPLLKRIESCDGIVIGAPVNAGSVNALTQRFVERCVGYYFWPWGTQGGPRLRKARKKLKAVLVSSSGAPAFLNSTWFGVGALHSLQTFAATVGADVVDVVKVGMVTAREVHLSDRTRNVARRAGEALCAQPTRRTAV